MTVDCYDFYYPVKHFLPLRSELFFSVWPWWGRGRTEVSFWYRLTDRLFSSSRYDPVRPWKEIWIFEIFVKCYSWVWMVKCVSLRFVLKFDLPSWNFAVETDALSFVVNSWLVGIDSSFWNIWIDAAQNGGENWMINSIRHTANLTISISLIIRMISDVR